MTLTLVDLFCGAGGLSAGMEMAGFRTLAGVDHFPAAGETFGKTHPHAVFMNSRIEDVSAEAILNATGLARGELTVLAGGPPCQAYSVNNPRRGMHDPRASLFREYLRLVDGLRPQWVVMENVVGIYSIGAGEAVRTIKAELNALGYRVEDKVLKAEEFGVPQERRRVIFIGNRIGAPIDHPEPTHGPGMTPCTTIRDALGDLPALENGQTLDPVGYRHGPQGAYQAYLRGEQLVVKGHGAPKLGAVNLRRLAYIPPGGSWRDIPHDLLPAGMQKAKRSDHTKRYGRMKWDGLSCTVLTKCDIHWGAFIHPDQDRAISVREAARLQSFPDWFEFAGSRTEQFVQIGNAVPPLLGRAIGDAIRSSNT